MSTDTTTLDFVQGDTVNLYIDWKDENLNPSNLLGSTIRADLRKEYNQNVLASFSVDPTDLANGLFTLTLSDTDSAALPFVKKQRITSFVFDIDVVYANGETATPVFGYIKMQRQVTR